MATIDGVTAPSAHRPARRRPLVLAGAVLAVLAVAAAVVVLSLRDGDEVVSPTTSTSTSTSSSGPPASTGSSPSTTSGSSSAPTVSVTPPPPSSAPDSTGTGTGPGTTTAPSGPATVLWQGRRDARVVTLTFDAGSDLGRTARILDLLATEHITATFGITGRFAEQYPDVVARIAAAGHQLVNHTADHRSFTGASTDTRALSAAERADQLRRGEAAIRAATGGVGTAGWFRPPYGDLDTSVERDVAAAGWSTVLMWTVDSLGWKGLPADQVAAHCLERAEPGAIYLFHVGSDSTDAEALPRIVAGLRAAGYAFAPANALPR